MISNLKLEVDKEFLETYRDYQIDSVLDKCKIHKTVYIALNEFIEKSTYTLNRLFEELNREEVERLTLDFSDYSVDKHYNQDSCEIDDLLSGFDSES